MMSEDVKDYVLVTVIVGGLLLFGVWLMGVGW